MAVSSNIVKTLLEREWVRVVGHKDVPGRPAMYATTRRFLDYFNLKSLDELPTLAEIKDLDDMNGELELEGADTPPQAPEPNADIDTPEAADSAGTTEGDSDDDPHATGEDEAPAAGPDSDASAAEASGDSSADQTPAQDQQAGDEAPAGESREATDSDAADIRRVSG